jgi:hypothetical protein
MSNAKNRDSNTDTNPMTDQQDGTVDVPHWRDSLTYVLLAVLLLAMVFGAWYGIDAIYYGE